MNKYALIYLYEGVDDLQPFSTVMAVSSSKEKLQEKMLEWVDKDTEVNEDDEWDDNCNFHITSQYDSEVYLQHNNRTNLYAKYSIQIVEEI
jgi:hypothetical protein